MLYITFTFCFQDVTHPQAGKVKVIKTITGGACTTIMPKGSGASTQG